jgi:hypothetical protein
VSSEELQDRRVWLLSGALVLFGGYFAWSKWDRTPQIGADESVFKTVDALFTAMTSKDTKRLEQCASRLAEHRQAGRLPEDSAELLDSLVAEARSGEWKTAAERLYATMLSQRREKS